MDDEDDRRLLDIIGDVQALNDYLHGSNSKSIEEDDVTNAAYGSAGTFFTGNTAGSNSLLKDGSSSLGEFGEDSAGAGLQLSSSLSFIEDELGGAASPGGVDLGGEDQPFDILQKSLMEADITEQTLAQEAMLDSQPPPAPVAAQSPFPPQLVSGGYGGGAGAATTATATFPGGQFLQGVSQLPNGSAGHIQVLGSFGGGGGVMTFSSLERSPQILLRQGGGVGGTGGAQGGQVFAPSPAGQMGQMGMPFKNIPLQNIIIQRGPGGTQTLVRPIQPKPLQAGAQTVYTTIANVVNTASPAGGHYTANGSILVHSPLGQQQGQGNLPQGQYLLTSATTVHNGPSDPGSNTLLTNQSSMQLVTGQNFTATAGGQLIMNQGVVGGGQVGGAMSQTWSGFPGTSPAPVQASSQGRLTLVGTAGAGVQGQVSASSVQRLLVTQTQNSTSLSPSQQQQDYRQDSSSPALNQDGLRQTQLVNLLGNKALNTMNSVSQDQLNAQVCAQKRPAPQQLTRGGMMLQHLRMDHTGVLSPDYSRFSSLDDALHRLLPYHVFHGAPPNQEEFSRVDQEFESVANQVLKRTQAMLNKYRRLLMVEAERSSPSSEMVMIDRTFNQEERSNLTQDKRMVLVDPDGYLEDFCCGVKPCHTPDPPPPLPTSSCSWRQSEMGTTDPPYRTDSQPGYGDPGGGRGDGGGGGGGGGGGRGGGGLPQHLNTAAKNILYLKRTQHHYGANNASSNANNSSPAAPGNHHHGNFTSSVATLGGQTPYVSGGSAQASHPPSQPTFPPDLSSPPHLTSPPPPDTDSVLEAAVNSILEC